jgi:glycosyltransferase involved in cell wall biosynthesis
MKIVYISSSTIPSRTANSIHVMKMCQAFANNGHEVTLIAPDNTAGIEPGISDIYDFYGVKKCFELIKVPMLPTRGRGHVYGYRAARIARQVAPDIVYCRNTPGCFFATRFKMQSIFESHAPAKDSGIICGWMFKKIIASKSLKKLVVITHALKDYYMAHYPQISCEIQVAPDGADPVPDDIVPVELPGEKGRLKVGYVGHLYKGKGMEIISELATACDWADFHVVGGTDQDIQFWKEKTIGAVNIFFHGHKPHSQTPAFLKAFDVLLLPNQDVTTPHGGKGNIAKWTSPLKAFEYMAAGKPIICSDLPVFREIFEDGVNALLCGHEDISVWHRALKKALNDNSLNQHLSKNATQDFIKKYTWKARSENIL